MKTIFISFSILLMFANCGFSQNGLETVYSTAEFEIRQFNSYIQSGDNDKRIYVQFNAGNNLNGGEYKRLNKTTNLLYTDYNGFLNPHLYDFCKNGVRLVPIETFVISTSNEQEVICNSKLYCDTTVNYDETLITLNGGVSFSSIPVRNSAGFDISADDKFYTAGTSDFLTYFIYKSTNRGLNWFITDTLSNLKKLSNQGFIKCSPADSNILFITGKNNLYVSTDFGLNFVNTNAPSFEKIYFRQNKMYGIFSNKIYSSSDKGTSWVRVHTSLTFDFTCLEFSSDEPNVIFAGTDNGLFKSTDNGYSWNVYNNAFPGAKYILGLSKDPVSNSPLYACTKKGIYKVLNEHYVPLNFISPFHIGNYFEYTYIFPATYTYFMRVISDTVFNNGKRYYKIGNNSSFTFEYIDSISLKWYKYDPDCPDSNTLIIDFLADSGHIFRQCTQDERITDKGVVSGWFGDTTHIRYSKNYVYPSLFGHSNEYAYAEKFGFTGSSGYVFWVYLSGAIIDGITYGIIQTSVKNYSNNIPAKFNLHQNYPNPFNPVTKIKFDIPNSVNGELSIVNLKIFDALGKEVQTLLNEKLSPGSYEAEFNGSSLSSGMYFYKLEAGDFSEVKRMMLIK